jgi:hypothetical protein
VCLLACKILGISSLTECPEDLVDKDIKSISAKIMGIIWPDGKRANLLDLDKTYPFDKHCYLANDSYILIILKMTYIPASC